MQRNSIVGNVAKIMVKNADEKWEAVQSIKGGEKGTKVFVNIADHYWNKDKGEQITRFVPMQGFVPRNLTVQVGMLVDVEFVINTYTKDGMSNVSMDITHWDVSLRSANKQQVLQQAAAGGVEEEIPEKPKETKPRTRAKANAKKSAA
ncbi:hypothetical protein C804_03536 [Lachnospiraceae bacterium A4]|nr:hypothetical protein C804_03536 [Lachnospiraceae bacterium A4]